jgi:hypothetical protein
MGKPSLKPLHRNTLSLTMQVTNRAGHGLRGGTPAARQDGPLGRPLEQAPPRSRARTSSSGLRPVRGATLPSSSPAPLEGSLPLERVSPRSRVCSALGRGPPRSRAPRTRAPVPYTGINALTPQDGAIMRPGLAPRCRHTNSPGRSPSPPLWRWTVRYGRCQSRDTARPLQYG